MWLLGFGNIWDYPPIDECSMNVGEEVLVVFDLYYYPSSGCTFTQTGKLILAFGFPSNAYHGVESN